MAADQGSNPWKCGEMCIEVIENPEGEFHFNFGSVVKRVMQGAAVVRVTLAHDLTTARGLAFGMAAVGAARRHLQIIVLFFRCILCCPLVNLLNYLMVKK